MFLLPAGADKKAEAGAGSATEFQFVSILVGSPKTVVVLVLALGVCKF